jgi:hypothetical protein
VSEDKSIRDIITTLVQWGHNEADIIWKYSMEMVYRYYEAIARKESNVFYAEAIRAHYVSSCTIPAVSKKHGSDMRQAWKKYTEQIHPDKIKRKAKKKKNPLMGLMTHPDAKVLVVD